MGDYNLIGTETLFAKIEEQLSSYTNNGLLDTSTFYAEIQLIINKLGIAAYELVDSVVTLQNYKTALPCNFYLLDSAWLCDNNPPITFSALQSNFVMYTQTEKETICQKDNCSYSNSKAVRDATTNGVIIQSTPCNNNNENILEKVTIKDYVQTGREIMSWNRPILMTLRNKKTLGSPVCAPTCKNLFAKSPYEITINQQGLNKYLHSTLEQPVIFLKYYAYPEDPETGLPLIPDVQIIQRAIEFHLMHYFFYMTWLNGNDVNIERKVQDLEIKKDKYLTEALNYTKIPSFNKSVEMARNVRRRFAAYEILNSRHL